MASLYERLGSMGVSADAVESLKCAGVSDATLLGIRDPAAFTDAEELAIDDADAAALIGALARIRDVLVGPLVFLDIDGVLNTTVSADHVRLDRNLCGRLREIVERTGASIVLSTFWREHEAYVAYVLKRQGIEAPVVGRTRGEPTSEGYDRKAPRSAEITAFLEERCAPDCAYVILDDREDASDAASRRRHVRTDPELGLTAADVARAVALLLE